MFEFRSAAMLKRSEIKSVNVDEADMEIRVPSVTAEVDRNNMLDF